MPGSTLARPGIQLRFPAAAGSAWLAACLGLGGGAAAQGHQALRFPELGLRLPCPNEYVQIPVPPREEHVALRFVKKPRKRREQVEVSDILVYVLSFDGADEESLDERLDEVDEWLAHGLPRMFGGGAFWSQLKLRGEIVHGETRRGYRYHRIDIHDHLETPKGLPTLHAQVGQAWVLPREDRTLVLCSLGYRAQQDPDDAWLFAIDELRFIPTKEPSLEKEVQRYERRGLSEPETRARMKQSLVRGWDQLDTENFVIVYNTGDAPLIETMARDLELLRGEYTKRFTPSGELGKLSIVRICHDMSEYLAYGAPDGSAGYFHPVLRELVLFDDGGGLDQVGLEWSEQRTLSVLYHEAMHQYMHEAVGEFRPHMWFNEGMGDYFGGAVMGPHGIQEIEPNEMRLERLRAALEPDGEGMLPWSEILHFSYAEFYDPKHSLLCYAQAWSMIWFLETAPAVQERPEWAAFLPTYFETLKETYPLELEKAERADPEGTPWKWAETASEKTRDLALKVALSGIDVKELEAAWRAFVEEL